MSDHGFPPLAQQNCLNCRYSHLLDLDDDVRLCKRHAPTVLDSLVDLHASPNPQAQAIWPTVVPEDWCGEWGPGEDPFVLGGGA
jgi:hypothetical protein